MLSFKFFFKKKHVTRVSMDIDILVRAIMTTIQMSILTFMRTNRHPSEQFVPAHFLIQKIRLRHDFHWRRIIGTHLMCSSGASLKFVCSKDSTIMGY